MKPSSLSAHESDDVVKSMGGSIRDAGEAAQTVLNEATSKAAAASRKVRASAGEMAGAATAAARDTLAEAQDKGAQMLSDAKGTAQSLAQQSQASIEAYVRANPLRGVLIAVGLGIAVGLLTRK